MKQLIKLVISFLFSLLLVLIFSMLVSGSLYIEPKYLSLTLSGALGSLIYDILLDGSLELPKLNQNGSFQTGFIGDIFVGIGGGFIVYLFLPPPQYLPNNIILFIFVIGLIGGYGSKALTGVVIRKIIDRIEKADLIAQQARLEVKEAEDKLLDRLTDKDEDIELKDKDIELTNKDIDITILLNLYNKQIKKYQDETRLRTTVSFVAAIVSMVVGLLFVSAGAAIIINNKNFNQNTIAGGAISTIGGALSAYITATFMDIHRLSITQLNKYFEQPVKNDQILMARRLAKEIERSETREQAYLKIIQSVVNLIEQDIQPKDK